MKKFLVAIVIGMLLVAALATTAAADNGPHGGFTSTTDKCAGCHRAHSAQDPAGFLLVAPVEDICLSCHDGSGAYTNVVDGIWDTSIYSGATVAQGEAGYGLFAGGFTNAAIAHTWNGKDGYDATSTAPVPAAVTSTHNHDGVTVGTIWGSGNIQAGAPTHGTLTLECTSCHDPHGNAGRTGNVLTGTAIPSYRLLRFQPNGSNGFEAIGGTGTTLTYWNTGNGASTAGITVVDTAATNKWYTVNNNATTDGTVQFYRSRYSGGAWTTWSSYVAGRGDYAGRSYVYMRPAAVVSNVTNGALTTAITCKDGSGNLPAYPTGAVGNWTFAGYPCAATTGALFNNATINANGTGGAAGRAQLGYWCATCHDRYLANSGSRTAASGDAHYMYRHNSSNTTPCVDCHVAHGTTSVMTNTNTNFASASLTSGSILLKTDERSVCIKCHGHDINFQYTP